MRVKTFPVLMIGSVLGALLGLTTFIVTSSHVTAVAVIQLGKLPPRSASIQSSMVDASETQAMNLMLERAKSPDFARKIAERINRPELAFEYPAKAYGGQGRLIGRPLRDAGALEFKVDAKDEATALAVAQALAEQIITEQNSNINALQIVNRQRFADFELLEKRERQRLDDIDLGIAQARTTSSDPTYLLAERKIILETLEKYHDSMANLQASFVRDGLEKTQLVFPVTIVRNVISSPLISILIGIVAGLIGAFLGLQFYRQVLKPKEDKSDVEIHLGHLALKISKENLPSPPA